MRVKLEPGAYMPTRAHKTDAGYDLRTPEPCVLFPHSSCIIDTGVHIELPAGTCAVIISKSGLNINHDITATGLIDEGFSGTIKVKLYNHGQIRYVFERGDKVSQFVITKYYGLDLEETDALSQTDRGDNGYGSTGR